MNESPEDRWTYLDSTNLPAALQLVEAVVGHRVELERLGFRRTEDGYVVCWAMLERGQLSTTQVAAMRIAQGPLCAQGVCGALKCNRGRRHQGYCSPEAWTL